MLQSDILTLANLHKSYGKGNLKGIVVDKICFSLRRGECYGLLGPNGAGKTTTLRLCLKLAAPDGGRITLAGQSIPSHARQARLRVGIVSRSQTILTPTLLWRKTCWSSGVILAFQWWLSRHAFQPC